MQSVSWYHLLGSLSAALFLMTWLGLARQVYRIRTGRKIAGQGTISLSMNQFASSYFAFYAVMVLGIALQPFNHYLVWTRIVALLLILWVLFYIARERQRWWVFVFGCLALILAVISMAYRPYPLVATLATQGMMIAVTVVLVQGSVHQWWILVKTQRAGSLSKSLFASILIKDLSTLAFAATMPFDQAWPIWMLNGSSIVTRGAILVMLWRLPAETSA